MLIFSYSATFRHNKSSCARFSRRLDGSTKTHKDQCGIVDGGHHKWRVLQVVEKNDSTEWGSRFSKLLESIHKDVEDVFGIFKGRFRILMGKIDLTDKADIDAIFFSACILHNMLLKDDGWSERHLDPNFWTKAPCDNAPAWTTAFNVAMDDDDEGTGPNRRDNSGVGAVRGAAACGPVVEMAREEEGAYHTLRKAAIEDFTCRWNAGRPSTV